jgi:hypothetical protein
MGKQRPIAFGFRVEDRLSLMLPGASLGFRR